MTGPIASLRQLFDAACELPVDARSAWLEQHCADPSLRERVQRLLRAQAHTLDPLAVQAHDRLAALTAAVPAPATAASRRLGDFRLIRPVGQGGMATVYLAERSGFAQRVAVKLLHRTMLSDLDRRLFERERKALASLEHPNIARLIDGGVSEHQEPYLVMEYVDGIPITDYARANALTPDARIRLLIDVCDAVATAHARLIVHRDIKPSNVLVTADGRCKLLDFGVVKFLDDDGELTRQGIAGFTPDYAAPEQLQDGAISTATDVYALGVMTLELLVGGKSADLRRIRPSLAALQVGAEDPTLAYTQRSMARYLRGDLDNILQKCLEEDAPRRYQSAEALADDLRRFLNNQPVSAHPPSRWYVLRKFARRHRGGVIVTTLLALATLSSLALALWLGAQAREQAQRAQALAVEADRARVSAQAALRVSEEIQDFLIGMFDAAVPTLPQAQETSVRDLVLAAEPRVSDELRDAPEAAAEVYRSLAQIYSAMGQQSDALRMSARSVKVALEIPPGGGASHRKMAFADARLRDRAGDVTALSDMERIVAATPAADGSIDALYHKISLGALLAQRGRGAAGLPLIEGTLPLLQQNCAHDADACKLWVTALTNLASAHIALRNFESARKFAADALLLARRHLGEEHKQTATALGNLGMAEFYLGRYADALTHTQKSIATIEAVEGPAGTSANFLRQTLANLYGRAGRMLDALAVHQRVLIDLERQAQTGPVAAVFRLNYARDLVQAGRYDDAQAQLLTIREQWGSGVAHSQGDLARWHELQASIAGERDHDRVKALTEIRAALETRRAQQPVPIPDLIMTLLAAHRIATAGVFEPDADRYLSEAGELFAGLPQTPPAVSFSWWRRQTEFALERADVASATVHLAKLREWVGAERPSSYADTADLLQLRIFRAQGMRKAPDPAWLDDLLQRWGERAEIVRDARQLQE